ncbi:hypothetical protein [Bdellovibrio reynosensis]|uniref:Outer membrane protein beta-barrel domain-containing protein n=1 Tax=Bdellovibrio reynosensis TaxID=2835041 RepID=A0ABY4CC95_9BACT|nr:hypothetical protein [Bdellovibrio reynosensis]UOF02463.1 hypothetical protein MNR06_05805 [Bdellovibrio reynosensis]
MKYRLGLLAFLSFVVQTNISEAKEIPVQARFFFGNSTIDPEQLNTAVEAQGIKKFESAMQFGVEVTYPVLKYLDFGVRYTKHSQTNTEDTDNIITEYSTKIDQDGVLLVGRVPILREGIFRVDAFAGFGGTNTTVTVKSATQDGEYTRKEAEGWFSTPYAAYGVSAGIGYKQLYLMFEGGMEINKVSGFTRAGSVSANMDEVDLSGSYFTIGIMLDGIPGTIGK